MTSIAMQIKNVRDEIQWLQDHPFAGACGECDALLDRLADLLAEQERRRSA